ncbi:class I SAM-dependent methyltransferase [Advenella alkanexedens]|jgi:SAM-dependent methyltransferase|uniref:Class I SAM-dependent methyltransferase n=1 Tax=Advenella alkanexedens TaxID=1481665 RepID=A0ABS6NJA8_9BURK|nr:MULTISPECIES: class I SAM-dependent methyltransferase [Advenella]MBV4395718.1 class I SAM-dependent methyltransferase [Advenella alkanexedens]NLN68933.1 class I SAM-dependent methyltransferase [Alcaligenaceae bacterium]
MTVEIMPQTLSWQENEINHAVQWHSESGARPPRRIVPVNDTLTADEALRLAHEGVGLLWQGDYQNARQLLQAMARRLDKKTARKKEKTATRENSRDAFNLYRLGKAQRARLLGMLLIRIEPGFHIALRRAPDVQQACEQVYDHTGAFVVSLRELLGVIGAYEWRRNGVPVPQAGGKIHPFYGVFSPVRGEYLQLLDQAPLPEGCQTAFDIGTGTGVLSIILAKRGVPHIVATDLQERAVECARFNIANLGHEDVITVEQRSFFPEGKADLIVCNPPWLPAKPSSPLEQAVYDPGSAMLKGFLQHLPAHLNRNGQGWLIMSDFAEHLGLRSPEDLPDWIRQAGLTVLERLDIKPHHAKVTDATDGLHAARKAEVTRLWRLGVQD